MVFNQWFFKSYFLVDNHIIFIGHVQIASELGTLGILIAYAESKVNSSKFNGILLLALSIITMLYSKTSASYLVLSILIIAWIFKKNTFIRDVVNKYTGLIVLFLILIGTYLVFNDWTNVGKEGVDVQVRIGEKLHIVLMFPEIGRYLLFGFSTCDQKHTDGGIVFVCMI